MIPLRKLLKSSSGLSLGRLSMGSLKGHSSFSNMSEDLSMDKSNWSMRSNSSRNVMSRSSSNKRRRRRRSPSSSDLLQTETTKARPVSPEPEHPNLRLAKAFLQTWMDQDMEAGRRFVTEDYRIQYRDFEMEFDDYAREMECVFEAMPDFSFQYRAIVYNCLNDTVVLQRVRGSGHHTAKPYAFGPCEPIEPKGTYVENCPETITYHFRHGKICKQVVYAHGEMSGPPGIYTQLGGFPLM